MRTWAGRGRTIARFEGLTAVDYRTIGTTHSDPLEGESASLSHVEPAPESIDTRAWRTCWLSVSLVVLLGILHTIGAWISMGGWKDLSSEWPLSIHDHPVHFHSSVVANRFLRQSGTTAGYDPSFMAGYPKNLIFPQSSTMFDVANFVTGGQWPVQVYKGMVFLALVLVPWMIVLAGWLSGLRARAIAVGELLVLIFGWTEGGGARFPWSYAWFGMSAYLLAVPLSVAAVAAFSRYLAQGGTVRWLTAAVLISLALLVHVTTPMLLAPAGLAAYLGVVWEGRRTGHPLPRGRHLGVWTLPVVALLVNAFWWWPSLGLLSMTGNSSIVFKHEESIVNRFLDVMGPSPPIQAILMALVIPGVVVLARRDRAGALAFGGLALAGFGWGYLAGLVRAVDFLQPGRHTYAFYLAASVLGGIFLDELIRRMREGPGRLDIWVSVALLFLGTRIFGPSLIAFAPDRLGWSEGTRPFLTSQPSPTLRWIVSRVRSSMKPGERLLYEEGGQTMRGEPDPFDDGRFSGLLPYLTGVEMLGGPYLKVSLTTNFTQFGEGRLFGRANWDEAYFREYAAIYRPSAILCWSTHARNFCRSHPDLIEVVEVTQLSRERVDPVTGQSALVRNEILFGRVKGYGGSAVRGEADVEAEPGRLVVKAARTEEPDGLVVLRYHSVPKLRTRPPVAIEPVRLGDDPVPFIAFRPTNEPFVIEMQALP